MLVIDRRSAFFTAAIDVDIIYNIYTPCTNEHFAPLGINIQFFGNPITVFPRSFRITIIIPSSKIGVICSVERDGFLWITICIARITILCIRVSKVSRFVVIRGNRIFSKCNGITVEYLGASRICIPPVELIAGNLAFRCADMTVISDAEAHCLICSTPDLFICLDRYVRMQKYTIFNLPPFSIYRNIVGRHFLGEIIFFCACFILIPAFMHKSNHTRRKIRYYISSVRNIRTLNNWITLKKFCTYMNIINSIVFSVYINTIAIDNVECFTSVNLIDMKYTVFRPPTLIIITASCPIFITLECMIESVINRRILAGHICVAGTRFYCLIQIICFPCSCIIMRRLVGIIFPCNSLKPDMVFPVIDCI